MSDAGNRMTSVHIVNVNKRVVSEYIRFICNILWFDPW